MSKPYRPEDGNLNLLVTSDKVGSSGSMVTFNEYLALQKLGPTDVLNPDAQANPFETDEVALKQYKQNNKKYKRVHFYAGTYSKLVDAVKDDGSLVTYTAAAHDIKESQDEFLIHGLVYNFPHLTEPNLFSEYVRGYKNADIVICPSSHSKEVMESYGCKNVQIIPHGCHYPSDVRAISKRFIVGYLGANGPDKGIIYLIQAWAKLKYKDAQLVLAGRNPENLLPYVRAFGKGSIHLAGFIESLSNFYNNISVYVQPSVTEGFGMEVVEAMSYGRPVICSDGAGANDCVTENTGRVFSKRNIHELSEAIDFYKQNRNILEMHGSEARVAAKLYSWEEIIKHYVHLWSSM